MAKRCRFPSQNDRIHPSAFSLFPHFSKSKFCFHWKHVSTIENLSANLRPTSSSDVFSPQRGYKNVKNHLSKRELKKSWQTVEGSNFVRDETKVHCHFSNGEGFRSVPDGFSLASLLKIAICGLRGKPLPKQGGCPFSFYRFAAVFYCSRRIIVRE